ncbi:hypothetical protein [uncultured Jatrophihabitans sp.]|uniref:hypothetical protein n=1 Tax=uncultured Jatrophihabitans sp. TaxID=1610747 RepID=UPI0035CB59BD
MAEVGNPVGRNGRYNVTFIMDADDAEHIAGQFSPDDLFVEELHEAADEMRRRDADRAGTGA